MAIKVYLVNSNTVTRKIRLFLQSYNLEFETCVINRHNFTYEDFLEILMLTEDGVKEIISERSKAYSDLKEQDGFDIDELKLSELYELMMDKPSLIKTPIVISKDENRLVVGDNSEKLVKIVPKSIRKANRL